MARSTSSATRQRRTFARRGSMPSSRRRLMACGPTTELSALLMAIVLKGMTLAGDRPTDREGDVRMGTDLPGRESPARRSASAARAESATRRRWWPARSRGLRRLHAEDVGRGLGRTGGTLDKLEASTGVPDRPRRSGVSPGGDGEPDRPDRTVGPRSCLPTKKLYALRGRHGHRREHPADYGVDPEQEARGGNRRAGDRRQNRLGRLHENAAQRAGAGSGIDQVCRGQN